jgi:uncharacterized protein (TIGR01777 family)
LKNIKIVLAGGSGLIGRAIAQHAQTLGYEVVTLSRGKPQGNSGRIVHWDGKTLGPWQTELEEADIVVNLCGASIGEGRWTQARKREIRESRLLPTQRLFEAIAQAGVRPQFLQASAVGFYGPTHTPVDETSGPGSDFLAELALEWEAQTAGYRGPCLIARFGIVLAPEGGVLPRLSLPFKLFVGGPLGSGNQWFPWVSLSDAVRALFYALDKGLTGPLNVVAPGAVTNRELARALGQTLNRPAFLPTPAFALRALLGEQACLLLEGQRVLPKKLQDFGFEFTHPDIQSALQTALKRN